LHEGRHSPHATNHARAKHCAAAEGCRSGAKTTAPKFKSDAFEAVHASALRKIGVIDTMTMHMFDETCLAGPAPSEQRPIKRPPASTVR
jgi:hypothetical protein